MRRRLLVPLLIVLFFLACQISEEERIRQTLNRREEGLRKRDLPLYLSCISRSYQDKEENFDRLRNRIEGYFKSFHGIDYSHWDRSVHVEGRTATVIQQFHLEVERGGKKHRFSGKEALFLTKEGREWKIVKGL